MSARIDLVQGSVTFNPMPPIAGRSGEIIFDVHNSGADTEHEDHKALAIIYNEQMDPVIDREPIRIGHVGAGEDKKVYHSIVFPSPAGNYEIRLLVDWDGNEAKGGSSNTQFVVGS